MMLKFCMGARALTAEENFQFIRGFLKLNGKRNFMNYFRNPWTNFKWLSIAVFWF